MESGIKVSRGIHYGRRDITDSAMISTLLIGLEAVESFSRRLQKVLMIDLKSKPEKMDLISDRNCANSDVEDCVFE